MVVEWCVGGPVGGEGHRRVSPCCPMQQEPSTL